MNKEAEVKSVWVSISSAGILTAPSSSRVTSHIPSRDGELPEGAETYPTIDLEVLEIARSALQLHVREAADAERHGSPGERRKACGEHGYLLYLSQRSVYPAPHEDGSSPRDDFTFCSGFRWIQNEVAIIEWLDKEIFNKDPWMIGQRLLRVR